MFYVFVRLNKCIKYLNETGTLFCHDDDNDNWHVNTTNYENKSNMYQIGFNFRLFYMLSDSFWKPSLGSDSTLLSLIIYLYNM